MRNNNVSDDRRNLKMETILMENTEAYNLINKNKQGNQGEIKVFLWQMLKTSNC